VEDAASSSTIVVPAPGANLTPPKTSGSGIADVQAADRLRELQSRGGRAVVHDRFTFGHEYGLIRGENHRRGAGLQPTAPRAILD